MRLFTTLQKPKPFFNTSFYNSTFLQSEANILSVIITAGNTLRRVNAPVKELLLAIPLNKKERKEVKSLVEKSIAS